MPSSFRTPKTLADWLLLDHFRREPGLRRLRTLLVVGAMVLCLLGVAAALALPRGRQVYQAGPVSRGHAGFGDQCETCHTQPFRTAARFVGAGGRPTVDDGACRACHGEHAHHSAEEARTAHCAACHREHRGHPDLARVADGHCTDCHEHLDRSVKEGVAVEFGNVRDFAGHPEFALWRGPQAGKDSGRLLFSHHDHLVPLMLRGKDAEAALVPRQLTCGDCHRPDAGGLAMRPIRYQAHCVECHPLFAPFEEEEANEAMRKAAEAFRKAPVPHPGPGQSAETVRGVLRDRLTRLAQEHPAILTSHGTGEPARPIPGDRRAPPVDERVFRWVDDNLGAAERVLFDKTAGCLLCHQERGNPQQRPGGLPELDRPNVPGRWLPHSVFSHRSHQAFGCAECHKGAEESREAADVLIPRVEDCRRCHNSESKAPSGCTDCHAYHKSEGRRKSGAGD